MEIVTNDKQFRDDTMTLKDSHFLVFVGGNNSGKSTLLRVISDALPKSALVNVHRTKITGEGHLQPDYQRSKEGYENQVKRAVDDNSDKNIQVLQEIFGLKNKDRDKVLRFFNKYFPNKIKFELEDPENDLSAPLLMMKGHSITKQGSGVRAILEILVKLFDPEVEVLCIDEPELGLEPRLQKFLFNALKEKSKEKTIVLATHSHLFLDREVIDNNYICDRHRDNTIFVTQINSQVELRNRIYRLLGNELTDVGLPNHILIVEGISDTSFIEAALRLLRKNKYSVFGAGSDSKIKATITGIDQFLKFVTDLSPVYVDRVHILVDKQQSDVTLREWRVKLGDPKGTKHKVRELSQNGIEYYYPEQLLQSIFRTADSRDTIVAKYLKSSPNQYSGIFKTKPELAQEVGKQLLRADTQDATNEVFAFLRTL